MKIFMNFWPQVNAAIIIWLKFLSVFYKHAWSQSMQILNVSFHSFRINKNKNKQSWFYLLYLIKYCIVKLAWIYKVVGYFTVLFCDMNGNVRVLVTPFLWLGLWDSAFVMHGRDPAVPKKTAVVMGLVLKSLLLPLCILLQQPGYPYFSVGR